MQQLRIPGIPTPKEFKKTNDRNLTWKRVRTMSFDEGIQYILGQHKHDRKIGGFWIENVNKPAATRFKMFRSGQTKCVKCGLEGSVWHIERHRNDHVMPFYVNLYGIRDGAEIMMTWDHKIPRSLGGSNRLENAQCMCERCNSRKGNTLNLFEMVELVTDMNVHLMYSSHIEHTSINNIILLAIKEYRGIGEPQTLRGLLSC